jgi:hypothetical protein
MSNKDLNGFELPWALQEEPERSRIVINQAHPRVSEITEYFAVTMCFKDAIVHLQRDAMVAMTAHIRDAHKW